MASNAAAKVEAWVQAVDSGLRDSTMTFDVKTETIRLFGNGGEVNLERFPSKDWPEARFEVDQSTNAWTLTNASARLVIQAGSRSPSVVIAKCSDVVFRGGVTAHVARNWSATTVRLEESEGKLPNVQVTGGTLREASGQCASLRLGRGNAIVIGTQDKGLAPHSIVIETQRKEDDLLELENLVLWNLTGDDLDKLRTASRFSPWWPLTSRGRTDIRAASSEALRMTMRGEADPSDDRTTAAERAHFWSGVFDLCKRSADNGASQAAAKYVSFETRRAAAAFGNPVERRLLWLSFVIGHGALVGRPIYVWTLTAICAAGIVSWTANCIGSPCMADPIGWAELSFDVAVSPVSFIRPVGAGDSLSAILDVHHPWERFIAFLARAVGTASLVSAIVAMRRLSAVSFAE